MTRQALCAAAAFAAAALLAGCADLPEGAGGEREVVVVAEGWAPVAGDSLISVRHRALAEAQKKAVETAVGVTVRASTKVDDAVNVRQSIVANVGGTIRSYEVLSERQEGGFYKARIRAVVLYRPSQAPKGLKPDVVQVRVADEKVADAIRATVSGYDYPLTETESDADVVVTGVVESYGRSDLRLGGFYSWKVTVSLSAVDRRTGRVIERQGEASALDIDEQAARDAAREQAGQAAGLALVNALETPAQPAASDQASAR